MNTPFWFVAKRYGWGWRPKTWQGWLTMIVWLLANIRYGLVCNSLETSGSDVLLKFAPFFVITTIIFLSICYKKGEKPSWHWGK